MKKILVLTSRESDRVTLLGQKVRPFLPKNVTLEIVLLSEVAIEVASQTPVVLVKGESIQAFDLIYFRGITLNSMIFVSALAIIFKRQRIKYFDTIYENGGIIKNKFASLVTLALSGVPIPHFLFYPKFDKGETRFKTIADKFGLPFVAKELSLQRGKGVHLIKRLVDYQALPQLDTHEGGNFYLYQEFLPIDHEYRVLVLGKSVGVWEEKIAQTPGEFRNNVALGAKEVFLEVKKIPQSIASVAIKSAVVLNVQVAGVDVMRTTSGEIFVIEVNRGPGMTYINESPEFEALACFFKKEVTKPAWLK